MQFEIVAVDQKNSLTALESTAEEARNYIQDARSIATRRAYSRDWRDFESWAGLHSLTALPAAPETVSLYLAHLAQTHKPATLTRRLASISIAHQAARHESPTRALLVRETMKGIRRVKGTAQEEKAPATIDIVRRMVAIIPKTNAGLRDRALLLLGFAGAFRRSELASLNYEDLVFTDNGIEITLRRSKTDQEGAGRKVGIPYGSRLETCPVRSTRSWFDNAGICRGPVFLAINRHGHIKGRLTGASVALIVKRYAAAAGLDAALFAGHSLRAGFATAAALAGVSERLIQKQTGHKGVTMLRKYIREGDLWRENAAADVGL